MKTREEGAQFHWQPSMHNTILINNCRCLGLRLMPNFSLQINMKIAMCLFLILYTVSAAGDELKERQDISDMAATLFQTEKFSELNKTSKKYLINEQRTGSGLWKLTLFYAGIAEIPKKDITDEGYWKRLEGKAQKWMASYPGSPTGYLIYADFLISHAWMYRGDGWAREVRSEDWKPFYEYIDKAKGVLNKNKKISSLDPRWYELMIHIAKSEGWKMDEFNKLVDEATKRFPFFYQIYFAAIDYLTPKWHGSKAEIEKFAQKAVAITYAREQNGMYARIYWYASQTNYGAALFTESAVIWEKMSESIDDVLKKYPDQWNINNFAYFACLARDPIKTNYLIKRIEGKPIMKVWKTTSFFEQCKRFSQQPLLDKKI